MKNIKYLFLLLFGTLLSLASCEENDGDSETVAWQKRNIEYIDSIAAVARANSDGAWKVFPATGLDENVQWGNERCVFCKVLSAGDGTESPAFTDSVTVNYKGSLVTGQVFDYSYTGDLEPEFDVPVTFSLPATVTGFSTALQRMVAGDTWRVYIPSNLGYGANISSAVPAYSALIFDINLVSFHAAEIIEK